jgi:osmoprotectant transport system permease protein
VNKWFCTDYLKDRHSDLTSALAQHLQITLWSLLVALVVAFPLALIARRLPRLQGLILSTSTMIYTIPSLALFPFLVPFTGISMKTVVIGLALYALTILVRSMLAGLLGVPDEVRESATGLGYGRTRLLFRIEVPLALPVIMAGLRVATVSTVALTTIGTLVSYGGLGNLIRDGVQNDFKAEILAASVLCVVLAVVLDAVIVGVQWVSTPWTHRRRTA